MSNKNLEKVLNQPMYWVEEINGLIYNALLNYKKENKIKSNTELAKVLGISKSRVSQIINDNEVNYSLEKLFEICFKINVFPKLIFQNKIDAFNTILDNNSNLTFELNQFSNEIEIDKINKCKIIPLNPNFQLDLVLSQ
ncbi:Helix-turn-helix [Halpernia humi]|uniref:Helix-turn-helix n=1 Tax=Halpernia humi TaxID=493375 RepID=A0A1H6AQL8_9FLAO|nr:helix-turn-helix transcriptional regulator [Halpernia humi]SEG51039.1 Helix-turn-helix [Halpernia humi]